MTALTIGPGVTVTLHFSLTLDDGNTVDSNFDGEPATFTVGDGRLLPGFEKALFGLSAGEEQAFTIKPEQGFGQRNPENIKEIPRSNFKNDMALERGLVVTFTDAAGGEVPGVVGEVSDERVVIDFNHPLAGRQLTFDVSIIELQPAVTH